MGYETRTTIIINKDRLKKVKFIALTEGKTIKEIIAEVIDDKLERWEKENGPILNI